MGGQPSHACCAVLGTRWLAYGCVKVSNRLGELADVCICSPASDICVHVPSVELQSPVVGLYGCVLVAALHRMHGIRLHDDVSDVLAKLSC